MTITEAKRIVREEGYFLRLKEAEDIDENGNNKRRPHKERTEDERVWAYSFPCDPQGIPPQ